METARTPDVWNELQGYAAAHRLGWLQEMPIGQFVPFMWYMLTRNADEREREVIKARLWQQEVGEVVTDARSPWSSANEGSAFSALKASMGGKMGAATKVDDGSSPSAPTEKTAPAPPR